MVEERRVGLERYLRQVLLMRRVYEDNRVWHFLEASAEVSIIVRYAWSKDVKYLKLLCPLSLEASLAPSVASCRPVIRTLLEHVDAGDPSVAGAALAVLGQAVGTRGGSRLISDEGGVRVLMNALGRTLSATAVEDVLLHLVRSHPESMFLYFQVDGGLSCMLEKLSGGAEAADISLCMARALVIAVAADPDLEIALTDRQSSGLQLLEALMAEDDLSTKCITGLIISVLLRRGNAVLLPHRDQLWRTLGEQVKRVEEVGGTSDEVSLFETLDAVLDETMEAFIRTLLSDNDIITDLTCNLLVVYFRGPLLELPVQEEAPFTAYARNERCWGRLFDTAVERLRWLVDHHGNVAASEALLACHGWCECKSVSEQTSETRLRCVELTCRGALAEKHEQLADSCKLCEETVQAQEGDVRRRGTTREGLDKAVVSRLLDAFDALERTQERLTASWETASMATGDSRRATDGLLLTRRKLLTMSQRMREKDIHSLAREQAEVASAQRVVVDAEDQLGKHTSVMADAKRLHKMALQALSASAELVARANARLADIKNKLAIARDRLAGVPARTAHCLRATEAAQAELHAAEVEARNRSSEADNSANTADRVVAELSDIEAIRVNINGLIYRANAAQTDDEVDVIWAEMPSWLTDEGQSSRPTDLGELRARVEECRLVVDNRILALRKEAAVARDHAEAAKELESHAREQVGVLQKRCSELEVELAEISDVGALEKRVKELQEAESRQLADVDQCKAERESRALELSEQKTRVEVATKRVEEAVEALREAEVDRDSKSEVLRATALKTDASLREIESLTSRLVCQTVRTKLETIMAAQHGCSEVDVCLRAEEETRDEALGRISEVQTHLVELSKVIRASVSKPDSGAGEHTTVWNPQ
ncbi:merozoite surface protein-3, putative [Perkinsus marinus ATCC 50983]|uniref:Merozoite surface protein-3, putative n=1 Tax=Perkinsus marinus (strain ATCC 50983 / TXsc) TaxID=423536 RepID=C5L693_PERM5|nr:merozoite surface protein-3, putative [Perkinsus marinus ATCC 50983]EER07720.1 merozoite surface protein-3, putative [Perkinsus marinus ATCC 50983]|eukprot:XP_002775904.1 merozoite surface protein-3, putative [Perkinsus marinus ATCC 50983]